MSPYSILIVDDDDKLIKLLRSYFEQNQFIVYIAKNGEEALAMMERHEPQIMLLDIMMPKLDGYEVCNRVRQISDIPIIFLTARDSEEDRLKGLDIGADDYVTKPFNMQELVARVHARLRRSLGEVIHRPASYRAADLLIDRERFLVYRGNQALTLTPTEFKLLEILSLSPGRVFSRMQLMEKVQGGYAFEGFERTIDTHIRNLRKKVEVDPANPAYILTVYGIGYKFGGEHLG
ncbi:response regulator transcription factor [Megasphaera vaginalis (ex Bordigoni et al. 2020)]|uniref:response regulator transcription factor n=1 Tax=Megasphaera vaginalis (ex Bordigoni et al. 2020) TaxID=2045301 RepID=UPI000C7D0936|nr:response regulator transcription factor [Megasphaera vaginalis (ex Bordigoni et al. 2020)]